MTRRSHMVPRAIPPRSRLAALVLPFLEPNFPRRWSDSDVDVDARPSRPSQPSWSLPNPAPDPLHSPLSFLLFLNGLLRGLSRLLPPAGIENASPLRPLAAPLTTPFLVDLHASSQMFGLGNSGGDDNTKRPMKEMPHRPLLSYSEGMQLRLSPD
jgi:hypothetical protein